MLKYMRSLVFNWNCYGSRTGATYDSIIFDWHPFKGWVGEKINMKCFKFLLLNGSDLKNLGKFGVAGWDIDTIQALGSGNDQQFDFQEKNAGCIMQQLNVPKKQKQRELNTTTPPFLLHASINLLSDSQQTFGTKDTMENAHIGSCYNEWDTLNINYSQNNNKGIQNAELFPSLL